MGELSDRDDYEYSTSEDDAEYSWIGWFCSRKGHEFLCEVDREFVEDNFNLYGLRQLVPHYNEALDMILDIERMEETPSDDRQAKIESSAEYLYGLIHARYILTSAGLNAVLEKYYNAEYGRCPRVFCKDQPVLPAAISDIPHEEAVKVFCPSCEDMYSTRSRLDGAFFTTSLPHLLMLQYADIRPPKPADRYIPRIYGYRIHKPASKK
mmetsp:Transcript_27146/g.64757  ORF Transcript_27146/g.64757 Transcript_27146/m.64757 type:complete len:209 (-) Transcript_27146:83-709(-)